MDFLIFYEHIVRELDTVLIIKFELEKRGYKVKIANVFQDYWKAIFTYRPKVVVVPWAYTDWDIFYFTKFLFRTIDKIVNLQSEQITSKKWTMKGYPLDSAKKAYHICWGEATKDRLINNGVDPRDIAITGAVHIDFYKNLFSSYSYNKSQLSEKYNIDSNKKWALFISSFSYAAMPNDLLEKKDDDIKKLAEVMRLSRNEILIWIEELININKDIIYIYRPHPNEMNDPNIQKIASKYSNFKIISELPLRNWILNCDYIDTWFSTAIVEAFVSGKMCNVLRPFKIPNDYDIEIYNTSSFIKKLTEYIESYNSVKTEFPIQDNVVRKYVDNIGYYSYMKVCDELEKIIRCDIRHDYYTNVKGNWIYWIKILVRSLIMDMYGKINIKTNLSKKFNKIKYNHTLRYIENNRDYISDNEIKEKYQVIKQIVTKSQE